MRPVPLYNLKQGINRLRIKGGANPTSLYDLLNAWITVDGSVKPREGTIRAQTLTSATKGLMADDGIFNVFSITQQSVPAGYLDNVLINPNDSTQALDTIWFAKPFMGFPYVVAQFANGDVFHYWLQNSGTWAPDTVYDTGTLILPLTTPTGLAYLATRVSAANPIWQPETGITLNAIIEPTEYTGFQYKAVAVAGASPHTGASEPVWPIVSAGTIQEFGDFDTSATDAGTTQGSTPSTAQPLSTTITDRYGDSSTIASAGASAGGTLTLPVAASTKVTKWAKGTLYAPGAVVQPTTTQGAFLNAIPNGDFENGNDGNWVLTGGVTFNNTNEYQGNECLQFTANHSNETATMSTFGTVTPGQKVTATAYVNPNNAGANLSMGISLRWYNAADTFLSSVNSPVQQNGGYRIASVTGTAPASAVHCRVQLFGGNGTSAHTGFADLVSWTLATPAPVSNFLFEAVQASNGVSASTEPTWPTIDGNTVVDNTVTWKAIGTSIITWEAIPIMLSGASEPVWPTTVPTSVLDASTFADANGVNVVTSISWVANSRQITDVKCPDTVGIALGASHVFAIDKDIVDFSAAVDPTDWSSTNNAGYLPTGLNTYGDNPAAVLALYRANLMAFNAGGYQMYQIDPDPANMALLDAQPIGSVFTRAAQSVSNDLIFLTEVGVRNLATVGATANMQIGSSGQPVDPLVVPYLGAGLGLVELLLHFEGANGQVELTDFSPYDNSMTVFGVSAISNTQVKFGNTSGVFQAASGWQTSIVTNELLDLGNGKDFTIEFWIYPKSSSAADSIEVMSSSDGNFFISWDNVNSLLNFQINSTVGFQGLNVNNIVRDAWNAIAITWRFNPNTKAVSAFAFLNGIGQGGFDDLPGIILIPTSGTFVVGNTASSFSMGWFLDEVRISRIVRNGNNAPPVATQPFPRAEPLSLYYPGRGQYWLIFENVAIVFTVNGAGLKTWSRYVFPDTITDWTLNGGVLYLRTWGDLVWQFNLNTLVDDFGGANVVYPGVIQTPYVDVGPIGLDKELIGVDLVGDGLVNLQIGWAQNDPTTFNDNVDFSTSLNVTPAFVVNATDTVPGQPIPFPMTAPSFTIILTFSGNQAWEWNASNLYISDVTGTATG